MSPRPENKSQSPTHPQRPSCDNTYTRDDNYDDNDDNDDDDDDNDDDDNYDDNYDDDDDDDDDDDTGIHFHHVGSMKVTIAPAGSLASADRSPGFPASTGTVESIALKIKCFSQQTKYTCLRIYALLTIKDYIAMVKRTYP